MNVGDQPYKTLTENKFIGDAIMSDSLNGCFIINEHTEHGELLGFCLCYSSCDQIISWLCSLVDDKGFIFKIFDEPEDAENFIYSRLWLDDGIEISIKYPDAYMTRH